MTYVDIETVEKYFKDINDQYQQKRSIEGHTKRILILETPFANKLLNEKYKKDPDYFKISGIKIVKNALEDVQGAIQIYDDKIGIITISNENIISIIIEDERINKLFRSMFEAIYSTSSEFTPVP